MQSLWSVRAHSDPTASLPAASEFQCSAILHSLQDLGEATVALMGSCVPHTSHVAIDCCTDQSTLKLLSFSELGRLENFAMYSSCLVNVHGILAQDIAASRLYDRPDICQHKGTRYISDQTIPSPSGLHISCMYSMHSRSRVCSRESRASNEPAQLNMDCAGSVAAGLASDRHGTPCVEAV